jgi:hypothetical protein
LAYFVKQNTFQQEILRGGVVQQASYYVCIRTNQRKNEFSVKKNNLTTIKNNSHRKVTVLTNCPFQKIPFVPWLPKDFTYWENKAPTEHQIFY